MSAKPAGGTDATEQSEPSEATEQTSTEQTSSFADALLRVAAEDGHEVGDVPQPKATDKPTETTSATEETEETEDTEPESEEEPATEQEAPEPVVAAKPEHDDKSIEGQIAAHEARGEKVPWYLKRIAEESSKRRERTEELRKAEERRQEAEAELARVKAEVAKSSVPQPTPQNPLADIYDEPSLQRLEKTYEDILEFSEKNRDGAENVVVGKDKDGKEIRKDFSPDEIADMRYKADKALRKDIPQRRGYLVARAQADAAAIEIYPEFKDPNATLTKEAISILRAAPQLETVLGPEVLLWIGHALKGRQQYIARNGKSSNGKTSATPATEKIERASQTKLAPTATKSRAFIERKGADLTTAQQKFEERGDTDSAEEYVGALLGQRSGGVRKLAPVEE